MSLGHHFLVPTTAMGDERFFGSLLYICKHSKDGAWGFIINKPSASISVGGLLHDMHIDAGANVMKIPAMKGGVMRTEAGFILHTGLPEFASSFAISENICLTTSRDILPHLAPNPQFSHYLVLMGFCSWGAGQLENEIHQGSWLSCPAKIDIVFHDNHDEKLNLVYQELGLNPTLLTPNIAMA